MAKTAKGKKIVSVIGYVKDDGTIVKRHRRSTPNPVKKIIGTNWCL